MTTKNYCAVCGGTLINESIRYDKRFGDEVAVFEDVPAKVCHQCGETWLDAATVEKMENIFHKKLKPTHNLSVPVWSLKKAA